MQYAVIDVETSGALNKITEIAIYVYDDEKAEVIEEYSTLVNPECTIPPFITSLTGIDNDMVASSPRFFEIAKEVYRITENKVFVAHNVAFDYNVIRNEFKELGADYRRKKLCTVRMSRKIFPGLKSYSLGKLCESLKIPIFDRHRATGDAKATTILLEMLLKNDQKGSVQNALSAKSKEASLPPNLPSETFNKLPDQTGVYYMHDADGKVIYVGKAKEIRNRIQGHFADNTQKKLRMKEEIFDISYQLTGSELLALIVEAVEIKNYFPKYNRAQKYSGNGYVICEYTDQNGVVRLNVAQNKKFAGKTLAAFSSVIAARSFLKNLCDEYRLCPKMCGLQHTDGACFDYQIKKCDGICCNEDSAESYNMKVEHAIKTFAIEKGTFIAWLKGRNREEKAFIYVDRGQYKGHGYIDKSSQCNSISEILDVLVPQKHNPEIQHILNSAIPKIPAKNVLRFETENIF